MKTRHVALIALSASVLILAPPAAGASGRPEATPVAEAAARTLELVNRERASAGLASLTLDNEVNGIAADWSAKMAAEEKLSHNGDYLSEASMRRLNATTVGENVAFADSIEEIHSLFMNSPPHRANILQADFRQVGIAAVRTAGGSIYLTEDFLTRRDGASAAPAKEEPPKKQAAAKQGSAKRGSAKKPPARKSSGKRASQPRSKRNGRRA